MAVHIIFGGDGDGDNANKIVKNDNKNVTFVPVPQQWDIFI